MRQQLCSAAIAIAVKNGTNKIAFLRQLLFNVITLAFNIVAFTIKKSIKKNSCENDPTLLFALFRNRSK